MIRRLRPYPTLAELEKLYVMPYDHTRWEDHRKRVRCSIDVMHKRLLPAFGMGKIQRVADLSAGDGTIVHSLKDIAPTIIEGDLVPRKGLTRIGPIEETIQTIEPVDLFVLTETIEHVENPDRLLATIRDMTTWLFLTTPTGEVDGVTNPEHIWEWDVEGMGSMIEKAGFRGECDIIKTSHYTYQAWTVR
jgi:hypothetical protein